MLRGEAKSGRSKLPLPTPVLEPICLPGSTGRRDEADRLEAHLKAAKCSITEPCNVSAVRVDALRRTESLHPSAGAAAHVDLPADYLVVMSESTGLPPFPINGAATGEHGDLLDVIRETCGLVVHHSDFDVFIPSHSRIHDLERDMRMIAETVALHARYSFGRHAAGSR